MRRTLVIALIVVAALATAGIAAAWFTATGTEAVSVNPFTATTVEKSETRTCKGADGNYEITQARYSGTATSTNAALAGPVRISVKSVYNTDKKLGWVEGVIAIRDNDQQNGRGRFWAVNTGGVLDGFVVGNVSRSYAALFGSLTAKYTKEGGFTEGAIGAGSSTNTALLAGRPCVGAKPGVAVKTIVRGEIDNVGADFVSVKPFDGSQSVSCKFGPNSKKPDNLAVKQQALMECDGAGTLIRIKTNGHGAK